MTDTSLNKAITINTLTTLKELGFNVTVISAAYLRNDGTQETIKKLIYEKESTHRSFISDLTSVQENVPELISKEEVTRMKDKRRLNPISFTDENAASEPTSVILRIEVDLDPSLDLAFAFLSPSSRHRRGRVIDFLDKIRRTLVVVREAWERIRGIWRGQKGSQRRG